ncbi:VWA domain-containing protein [Xanthomonadaceae bacterium JHOS43]|nr:VWA domain-containing protein [Xanthomonadaceae bacterium JHOS43]
MLFSLFDALRAEKVPVTLREWLDLMAALDANLVFADIEQFHALARAVLVKDERHFDRFDRAFGKFWSGVSQVPDDVFSAIPEEWLRRGFERLFTDEEKAKVEQLGGLEALMRRFQERLAEQKERHEGGNRWIGTSGTSPFGSGGHHPGGIRVGPRGGGRMAAKVWEKREYRNLDGDAELSPRNFKTALRRLRRFAREGAELELDLPGTIMATAREGGLLDVKLRPERHNTVKVLLLLDIGGSMDDHVAACEALFGAARSEFKRLEHFYFHNFVYEHVWNDNQRRSVSRLSIHDLLRRYNPDHRVVFVGDAAMGPYEITHAGGSVEHWNEEPGDVWFGRIREHFRKLVWINPNPPAQWRYTASTQLVRELVEERMYPLTPDGLGEAMRALM